jgi:hypothetical protein
MVGVPAEITTGRVQIISFTARACSTHGRDEKWGNILMRVTDHLGRQSVRGWITLKRLLEKQRVIWIHLAHDTDQWQALVNTVMNLQVR